MESPTAAVSTPLRPFRSTIRSAAFLGAASLLLSSCVTRRAALPDPETLTTFDQVSLLAADLASRPYEPPVPRIPEPVQNIDYDQYRKIPFLAHKALWRDTGLPFELSFYHPGYLYDDPVDIYIMEPEGTHRQTFDPWRFDYYLEGGAEKWSPGIDHYAGFLAMYPFDGGPWRECASFLGASYFRAIGSQHVYGSSVRALAIDIGSPQVEVFPRFTKFWIRKPQNGDTTLLVYALLDSPPIAGAYQLEITPGAITTVDVKADIHARTVAGKVAFAPVTSMYWHQPGDELNSTDFRPRVHDSEGLSIHHSTGEWLWRPASNPKRTRVSVFDGKNVTGFGLMQRHRKESDYLDEEALYHKRPSVWIEPKAGFEEGSLELLEIHAEHEGVDNLGAYWALPKALMPGDKRHAEWRITFCDADPPGYGGARTAGFMIRPAGEDGKGRRISVAFRGGFLDAKPAAETLRAEFSATHAEIVGEPTVEMLEPGVFSATATVRRSANAPEGSAVEVRAYLRSTGNDATETWTWRDDEV